MVLNSKLAPMEISAQFLLAVMNKDYRVAQKLCDKLIELEPGNKICKEFKEVLSTPSLLDESDESDEEDFSSEDDVDDDNSSIEESDEDDEESSSDEEEGSESDCSEAESSGDELSIEEINKLNLIIGGLKIIK